MGAQNAWVRHAVTAEDGPPIRDAATLILYRRAEMPRILMGQRGSGAAFMADKFVFPGGAVSPEDADVPMVGMPDPLCQERLAAETTGPAPKTLLAAAIRELWEETGLILGAPGEWPDAPPPWSGFAAEGVRPSAAGVRFIFRAVTPPGRPRRFDARFFLVDAERATGSLGGDGELSNLQWIPLDQVRSFSLPFITQVVLAELPGLIGSEAPPANVPFFHGKEEDVLFEELGGQSPLAQLSAAPSKGPKAQ